MKIFYLLILSLMTSLSLCAKEGEDNLYVSLETENPLLPLYLGGISAKDGSFSDDYVKNLERVLAFDFSHNGITTLVPESKELLQINQGTLLNFGDPNKWKGKNINYALKAEIQNKTLNMAALQVVNGQVKTVGGIALSGNLLEDRRKIHLLSDAIFKALFDKEGVATSRILYTFKYQDKGSGKWVSDLYESDYDGANIKKVVSDGGYIVTPSYIPPKPSMKSGSSVFVSYKNGQPKIFLANLKDGQIQRFSLLKGNQLMPTISRQKDKIAFISDVTGNPDLFLQDFDPEIGALGKPRQIYSTHKATQASPTFSPDGKKIAFVSNKDGSPKIYVIDIPEPNTPLKEIKATLISKTNRENTAPSWSSDGKKIVYCAMTKGVRQIWMYDFDLRREVQLTTGPGNKENPSFAPNSFHIVFNSTGNNGSDLYLINLNQKEPLKITSGLGEKHFPSFEPKG